MVPAGTAVVAYVSGASSPVGVGGVSIGTPERLEGAITDSLSKFGAVTQPIKITRGWLSPTYTSTVQYTTWYPHSSWEDIRATIAGVFQAAIGTRPSVTIPASGDQAAPKPDDGEFNWLPLAIFGGIAVVGLVVLLPYTRRAA